MHQDWNFIKMYREEGRGGERGLHLFSPPCSEQKQDDLCGASAASPRCGRILAFSSAPSRVARVAECGIAFALSRSSCLDVLPQRYDASFLDDYRPPSPLSPAHPLTRVDAHSRGEANHRARLGLAIIFTPDPGNFRRNNTGGIGIRVGHGGYRGRKPV